MTDNIVALVLVKNVSLDFLEGASINNVDKQMGHSNVNLCCKLINDGEKRVKNPHNSVNGSSLWMPPNNTQSLHR